METTIGLAPETTTEGKPTRDMRQRAGDACLALAGTLSAALGLMPRTAYAAMDVSGTLTNVTKEALGMLAANAWADGQGTAVVTFTDRAIRTTTQGGEEWGAYAVSASARKSVTDEGAASAVTTLCLGTSEWPPSRCRRAGTRAHTPPSSAPPSAVARRSRSPPPSRRSRWTAPTTLPMLVSALICSMLVDVATIISMVVVWGRGMQLYFMATMSPIPLALLGIDETRQMGVGFLRNYAALVLGYAALSFVVKLFPTLLQMSIATSFVMGGDGEMILSITAACILEIILTVKCGGWARDVLGG